MFALLAQGQEVAIRIVKHLIRRIDATPAVDEPFSHMYLEEVFPQDIYEDLLRSLPPLDRYLPTEEGHHNAAGGAYVRLKFALTLGNLAGLSEERQSLWNGVADALTSTELKRAVYQKLARDLARRYGVPEGRVGSLAGYACPTLYRETAGFEIPPHAETGKQVVAMHFYLPPDHRQLNVGTALYRRKLLAWPFGDWRRRFEKVKQFPCKPNSGYAFVLNNGLIRRSWHGRGKLPVGAGVRNTLLTSFYERPLRGFGDYVV